MKHGPDLNRISSIIFSWRRGLLTLDEVTRSLKWLMDPANFLPEAEQIPEPMPSDASASYTALLRVEQKLNTVIKHAGIPIPNELNPVILGDEAKELLRQNNKIGAVKAHRDRTGAGLADAKKLIEAYLNNSEER